MIEESSFLAKEKKRLRRRMLALRRALSSGARPSLNKGLFYQLISLPEYEKAHCIMAYLSMPDESGLDFFISFSLSLGKNMCVPVCLPHNRMEAGRILDIKNLEKGPWGLRNIPAGYEVVSPKDIDIVLIPAVAYDEMGRRLGMGKGYYDRFLENIPFEKRIGVAWNFQVVPMVPSDIYDKRVSKIVTEERIINVKGMMS